MDNERNIIEASASAYTISSTNNLVPVKSGDTYFKRKRRISLLFTIVLAFLLACLIATVIVLAVLYSKLIRAQDICDNENCIRTAASLKESMDTSIDPCDDFYRYACGKWPEEHPISNLENSWFIELYERINLKIRDHLKKDLKDTEVPWAIMQAKNLYESCIDIESIDALGLEPLLDLLEQLELPQIPAALTGEHGNIIELMANVRRDFGKAVLIGFNVDTDPRDKHKNIVYLDAPNTGSLLPSYNVEIEKRMKHAKFTKKIIEDESEEEDDASHSSEIYFTAYMVGVTQEIISNGTASDCLYPETATTILQEKKIMFAAHNIYNFGQIFRDLVSPEINNTDIASDDDNEDNEDYMLIDDLQRKTDQYVLNMNESLVPRRIWRPFLEEVFRGVEGLNFSIDEVMVGDVKYLKRIAYVLTVMDDVDLETIIWWAVVDDVVPHSSRKLRELWREYVRQMINYEFNEPQSVVCANLVNTMMGMATAWLFVDRDFNEKKSTKVAEMFENIRSAFTSVVYSANWIDEETKLGIVGKSSEMGYSIGHPDWLFDENKINKYYEGLEIRNASYLENMLSIVNAASINERKQLHEPNSLDEPRWDTDPTDVNAVYSPLTNRITIPEAMLQFPFFELGLQALNFGTIGFLLGHEFTHGFDDDGISYDATGHRRQWLSDMTHAHYENESECFVEHYGNYYIDEVDDNVDGDLTLSENIADNGGLRQAILAYRRWMIRNGQEPKLPGFVNLSHEQLLFLGFARFFCGAETPESLRWDLQDSHSPQQVRVLGVLRNSPEFSEAWNCPRGSLMNPEKKCKIW